MQKFHPPKLTGDSIPHLSENEAAGVPVIFQGGLAGTGKCGYSEFPAKRMTSPILPKRLSTVLNRLQRPKPGPFRRSLCTASQCFS